MGKNNKVEIIKSSTIPMPAKMTKVGDFVVVVDSSDDLYSKVLIHSYDRFILISNPFILFAPNWNALVTVIPEGTILHITIGE